MPIGGWLVGGVAASVVGPVARYLAAAILFVIAVRMILNVIRTKGEDVDSECDPTLGWSLIMLSIATSIDAFGAGIGLGLMEGNLFLVCVVIGITAALMTLAGMTFAGRLSAIFGKRIEALGGIVLLALSFKFAFIG
jgi:putative Mn2+ efflux pump MntP